MKTLRSRVRVADWPLAVRLIALGIGITGALAAWVTVMGYVQAAHGLAMQAEATLGSDGLVVATTVDNWAAGHAHELDALASHRALQRALAAGSADADPTDAATVKADFEALVSSSKDIALSRWSI